MSKIRFTKMHGAGNDYIYVYTPENPIANPGEVALEWSKFHTGIGSDGLILIGNSNVADFSMRMFNNDGSEGRMCGNGIRCVGKFVYEHRLTRNKTISVETLAGIKTVQVHVECDDTVSGATVDMGEPILSDKSLLATPDGSMKRGDICISGKKYTGTFVSMGSPHFVIFVDDINQISLAEEGATIEQCDLFPQGCNIEFAQIRADKSIRARVWERGSGITLACGTGACAVAVAAFLNGKSGRQATVAMDGGNLSVEWNSADNHVYMTGPSVTVFEGEINL